MKTKLFKQFTAEASAVGKAGDGDRRIRFVISDGSVDRENDTIAPEGWDLSAYRKNPVVLWAHSHRDLPIGKAVEITAAGGRLEAVAEFAEHAFAESVYQLYKGGFLRAVSVGFRPLEWTRDDQRGGINFIRQELLEFSGCPVGANAHALATAAAQGIDTKAVKAWARAALDGGDDLYLDLDDELDYIDLTPTLYDVDARELTQVLTRCVRVASREFLRAETERAVRYFRGEAVV